MIKFFNKLLNCEEGNVVRLYLRQLSPKDQTDIDAC